MTLEDLFANVQTKSPEGEFFTFEGDLNQMLTAANTAIKLGIKPGIAGGLPYVRSREDFDRVIEYIVDNHIEGYWHYT